jgi:hypothetical protein
MGVKRLIYQITINDVTIRVKSAQNKLDLILQDRKKLSF